MSSTLTPRRKRRYKQPRTKGPIDVVAWLSDPEDRNISEKKRQAAYGRFHAHRRLLNIPEGHEFRPVAKTVDVVWDGDGQVTPTDLLRAIKEEVQIMEQQKL